MEIIESYEEKKIIHHLMECKTKKLLFVLPTIISLNNFDPILSYLRNKFPKADMISGLLETIKNRQLDKKYVFINMMNIDMLKQYGLIFRLPEIFDYSYFIPEFIGVKSIPDIMMTEQFNFVLTHYNIENFSIVNVDKDIDIPLCVKYIDSLMDSGISSILIGDSITCAEITNVTKTNPIVIYKRDVPIISDLIKKCKFVVGNIRPDIYAVVYKFVSLEKELEVFKDSK
jgi:hypothetical protein